MLLAFIDLFCRPGSTVTDPFAGTMTTDFASMSTARSCIVMERNLPCYRAAAQRLRTVLPSSSCSLWSKTILFDIDSPLEDTFANDNMILNDIPRENEDSHTSILDSNFLIALAQVAGNETEKRIGCASQSNPKVNGTKQTNNMTDISRRKANPTNNNIKDSDKSDENRSSIHS